MKNLILIILLIPCVSFGQKLEVSELAGCSLANRAPVEYIIPGINTYGFSNQLSFGYHLIKHFSINAFYEFNAWNTNNNSLGIAPSFICKYFYTGIDIKKEYFTNITNPVHEEIKYKAQLGYGIFFGSKQKISKHLFVMEQIGYDRVSLTSRVMNLPSTTDAITYTEPLINIYLRIGLSYRLIKQY